MNNTSNLPEGYEIREMSSEEFDPLWQLHGNKIFDDNSQIFRFYSSLAPDEAQKFDELNKNYSNPFALRLGLFYRNDFCGWSFGHQEPGGTFYMRNSAILPEHRRKGLYTALMKRTIEIVKDMGFQRIYSRHNTTNNAVIIPKLKAGFIISNLEISDTFGVLVHLTLFTNPLRRKIMDYRVGEIKPDKEIKKALEL